jgi:hypothetical protein
MLSYTQIRAHLQSSTLATLLVGASLALSSAACGAPPESGVETVQSGSTVSAGGDEVAANDGADSGAPADESTQGNPGAPSEGDGAGEDAGTGGSSDQGTGSVGVTAGGGGGGAGGSPAPGSGDPRHTMMLRALRTAWGERAE